jgi:proteic killer suppression protein
MELHSFKNKALERFYRHGSERGLPAHSAGKLRNQLAFLESMDDTRELLTPVLRWKAHTLSGARSGTLAISVTANRRLTFTVDVHGRLCDLNLEDYH